MADSERRQRVITSTPHLSPEEVANRAFGTGFRGYAEAEVRSFLKRISEQLSQAREREHELAAAVDALEEQLRQPRPLTEQELLDALGEETARLLRSAREAADDIRRRADEKAARLIEDAQHLAERTRAEAEEMLAARTQEVETRVADLMAAAEARVRELCDTATAEAESTVESARRQGREMLDEAKAARERVLGDLVRRRALLHGQIEELRGGRDRLLDAYRTVKRTFLDATEALVNVEARAAAERATAEPIDVAAEIAAEIEALEGAGEGELATAGEPSVVVDLAGARPEPGAEGSGGEQDSESIAGALADVDSLFARIRGAGEGAGEAAGAGEAEAAGGEQGEPNAGAEPAASLQDEARKAAATEWRAIRSRAVDPLLAPLLKKTKRRVQDDQNALLDAVRRHKGRPTSANVLPDLDTLLLSWALVLRDAIDKAYGSGLEAAGAERRGADEELVREAAGSIVLPLRERLTAAIDSGEPGDTSGLVERIGARHREWKSQSLEAALADALAFVWSRGVYDGVPDGAVLWWVPWEEGRCPDCDDNGLEPTVKGKDFPTGQPFPPAHPGCRCALAPAVRLDAIGESA
jgi:DivIVA domain-containing protein